MPCPFTVPKMFCAGPNFLSQPKNLTAFSASSKTFVLAQKPILLNANHLFVWHKNDKASIYINLYKKNQNQTLIFIIQNKFDLNWPAETLMLYEFYNTIIDRFHAFDNHLTNYY